MASKTFSSLSIRNYRIYFFGLLVANIGSWMATTAKSWLVLVDLTKDDATALGYLTALIFLPAILTMPIAGSIADRIPKRKLMLAMLGWQGVNSVVLAYLVLGGHIQLWMVFLLAFLDGMASSIAAPAQQAFVSEVVPRSSLTNAISLNSAQFNAARLIGPGVAGALIKWLGTGTVLAVNCFCFVFFIASLVAMRANEMTPAEPQRGRGQLVDGLRYVKRRPDIMLLIGIAFMMGNFGFNFSISNAVMARTAFARDAGAFGALGSIMGIGALAAALVAARRGHPRLRHVLISMACFAVVSAAAALAPTFEIFAVLQIPVGFTAITVMVTANALVQMNVAAEYRGRVMALWSALLVGGTPLVSPTVGWLGTTFGPRATVWFEGISMALTFVVATTWIMRSDHIRLRLDRGHRAPWLVLERGEITEEIVDEGPRSK